MSYDKHITEVNRKFDIYFMIHQDEFEVFQDLCYMLSCSDGRPLSKKKTIEIFEHYYNSLVSFELLEDNLNRYDNTIKINELIIDDFNDWDDLYLWLLMYL